MVILYCYVHKILKEMPKYLLSHPPCHKIYTEMTQIKAFPEIAEPVQNSVFSSAPSLSSIALAAAATSLAGYVHDFIDSSTASLLLPHIISVFVSKDYPFIIPVSLQ
jgi:hypothetical protein